jgi:DNA polymerase-3 subunit beta
MKGVVMATAIATSVEIDAKVLAAAVRRAKKFTPTTTVLDVLKAVRIHKVGREVVVEATDMESHIRVYVAAEADGKVDLLVPIKDLQQAIKGVEGPVRLAAEDDGRTMVQVGRRRLKLPALRAEDWPEGNWPARPLDKPTIHAVGSELEAAIATGTTFASTDHTRPILTGVLLDTTGKAPAMVGTDSYFMGVVRLPGRIGAKAKVNVPWKPLLGAVKGLRDDEGVMVDVYDKREHAPTRVVVRRSGEEILIRTIDGKFPDYSAMVPAEESWLVDVTLSHETLLEVLQSANAIEGKNAPTQLILDPVAGQMRVQRVVPDGPELDDVVEAKFEVHDRSMAAVAKVPEGRAPGEPDRPAEDLPEAKLTLLEALALMAKVLGRGEVFEAKQKAEAAAKRANAKMGHPLVKVTVLEERDGYHLVGNWPMRCGYNSELIADAVEVMDGGETLRMRFISPLRPAVIESANGDFALVMPIRLGT